MGLRFWHSRKHHIFSGVPCTSADVRARVPEEVDGGVQLCAVRGGALQLHALDLLRPGQDQLQPSPHHQWRRLRHRDPLHRPLPPLRAQMRQAEDTSLLLPAERRRLRAHRHRHRHARRGAPPGAGPRQHLPRLLHGRLRRAHERHSRRDKDEERGVHALLAVLLPHPQRRRVVPLRPLHQGPLRHTPQRGWLLLRLRPDGALLLLPEAEGPRAADDDRRRRTRDSRGDDRAAGGRRPVGEPHVRAGRAEDGAGAGGGEGDDEARVTMALRSPSLPDADVT